MRPCGSRVVRPATTSSASPASPAKGMRTRGVWGSPERHGAKLFRKEVDRRQPEDERGGEHAVARSALARRLDGERLASGIERGEEGVRCLLQRVRQGIARPLQAGAQGRHAAGTAQPPRSAEHPAARSRQPARVDRSIPGGGGCPGAGEGAHPRLLDAEGDRVGEVAIEELLGLRQLRALLDRPKVALKGPSLRRRARVGLRLPRHVRRDGPDDEPDQQQRGKDDEELRRARSIRVATMSRMSTDLSRRAPSRLLRLWKAESFALVISAHVLAEVLATFEDPYFRKRPIHTPKDDLVLAAAVGAEVDYLVTGDKNLLRLGGYQGIRIRSPRQFLDLLEGATDAGSDDSSGYSRQSSAARQS